MWVFFVASKEKRLAMNNTKIVYCPLCWGRVASYDGKSKINPIVDCKKCNVRVIYDIEKDKTEVKKIPYRETSSGKTFY